MAREFKSWLEILEYRKMAKDAKEPPSDEQVEEAVARRLKEIADKKALADAAWDIEYENLLKSSRSKLN